MPGSTFTLYTEYANQTEADASGSVTDTFQTTIRTSFTQGTGPNQADRYYRDPTGGAGVTAGSSDLAITYTLSNLPGGQGMVAVRKLFVQNLGDPAAGTPVYLAPAASNGWAAGLGAGAKIPVLPGGVYSNLHSSGSGVPVTAGSDDTIAVIVPANTTGYYWLCVEGCSAGAAMAGAGSADAYGTAYGTGYNTAYG